MSPVALISDPATVQVLSHPIRIRILEALREARSAASVARDIGQTRQNTNYHLKELERVELVRKAGQRRVGNFLETLYLARARTLLVSPRLTWGGPARPEAMAAQVSLERLVGLSERLGNEAVALLDRAAFEGETIPTASMEAEVCFKDEQARSAFLSEYVTAVAALTKKYGARAGEPYRVAFAAYPDPGM